MGCEALSSFWKHLILWILKMRFFIFSLFAFHLCGNCFLPHMCIIFMLSMRSEPFQMKLNEFWIIFSKFNVWLKKLHFQKYSTQFHLSTAYINFRKNNRFMNSKIPAKATNYPTATCLINIFEDNENHGRCHSLAFKGTLLLRVLSS